MNTTKRILVIVLITGLVMLLLLPLSGASWAENLRANQIETPALSAGYGLENLVSLSKPLFLLSIPGGLTYAILRRFKKTPVP